MQPSSGEIRFFMNRTEKDLDEIKTEMNAIHDKIDKLWSFRALLVGMATASSAVVTVGMHIFLTFLTSKK